jgi:hypothetical protein
MIYPFLHEPNDPSYLHFREFKNFQGNVLHIGYILNGSSRIRANRLLKLVERNIKKLKIDLVVLDCTGEPWDIEFAYIDKGSPLTIQKILNEFCKTIIVTEDWYYYYNPKPNIVFFPYNIWIQSTKKLELYYENCKTFYNSQLEKSKPLMCLNRNLQWHRLYVLDKMAKASWLSEVDFSFVLSLGNKLKHPEVVKKLTANERKHLAQLDLPIFLDYEKGHDIRFGYNNGASNVNTPVYDRCAVNLITETSVDEHNLITEKTTKAFSAYQIPIVIGKPGVNQYLEDLGMDMFKEYVPWESWDKELNPQSRMEKIFKFVNKIMEKPIRILKTHKRLHPRLIRNKEYFHSAEFADRITSQLNKS